jgi:hypothetical protein
MHEAVGLILPLIAGLAHFGQQLAQAAHLGFEGRETGRHLGVASGIPRSRARSGVVHRVTRLSNTMTIGLPCCGPVFRGLQREAGPQSLPKC